MINKLKAITTQSLFLVITGFAVSYVFGWLAVIPVFILLAILFKTTPGQAMAAGTSAGALIWGAYANYLDNANQSLLSGRVGELFMGISTAQLLWLCAAIGGLIGGFATLTGSSLRELLKKDIKRKA